MALMTAITSNSSGQLSVAEVERPVPGSTEVLIRVAAAGVNPVDWKTSMGQGPNGLFADQDRMILGWDVAGTVEEVGPGVTKFTAGDRVFGMPNFPHPAQAYAEYVVAGARQVARTPDNVSDIEAGAAPLAILTAWQAVVDTLKIARGQKILIHAASGGVGHLALQIAKVRGAQVWATASEANHDKLRELGADHVIDYRTERFEEVATGMDAVLDLVGHDDYPVRSLSSLRRGGQLLLIPAADQIPAQNLLDDAGVTACWMLVEPDYAALETVASLMGVGALHVIVGETRPLEKMAELHAIGTSGGPFGKLVATVA